MDLDELIARESIRDRIALVSQVGDALDHDAYVACYAPDGVLDVGLAEFRGRDVIRAQMERSGVQRVAQGATVVRHNVTSTVIRLTAPDRAEVRSYYHVYGVAGPDHFGHYHDEFVRIDGEWLIARRAVDAVWASAESRHVKLG